MDLSKKSVYQSSAEELFKHGRSREYAKNQLIHYQGDKLSHLYLIEEGFIKAYAILDSGDTRTILILGPGDIFPIAFSVTLDWDRYHVKYFYQTLTEVRLKTMESGVFKEKLGTDPKTMQTYLAYLSATNQAIMNQLEVMKNKKAINKVGLLLPYLIIKLGERIKPNQFRLKIRLSHQEIADLSGVTRETTTTLVKQLEKGGLVKQVGGHWIINAAKLESGPFDED